MPADTAILLELPKLALGAITATTIPITWNIDKRYAKYYVYINDVQISTVTGNSYTFTGLKTKNKYMVSIYGESAAGRTGAKAFKLATTL